MARPRAEHQPSDRRRVLRDPGAERDRQLGEGHAAHSCANLDRHALGRSRAARRHECRRQHRHGLRAPGARLPDDVAPRARRGGRAVKRAEMNAASGTNAPLNRGMITVSIMLATIMQVVDMTIVNVALPHMQGSMSATQDQISWVLTSYIVSAAIMTPLTGPLAMRLGRKRLFIYAVIGFTIASMLCGMAQS